MLAFIAATVLASQAYELSGPGDTFPVFDTNEHCRLMEASASSKIAHLGKSCAVRELEYKTIAVSAYKTAVDSDRSMCEIDALGGIGSYQVLGSCLNAQTTIRILLKMPLRGRH